eukprot:3252251-Pleurochrysis_carterae.AAC.5
MQADLLAPGAFDECIHGADAVFHTASPFITEGITDPHAQLIAPSLDGTRNVFGSVAKSVSNGQVKPRIVVTSSIAAVLGTLNDKPAGQCFSEDDWNSTSTAERGGLDAYRYSKLVAEQEAWKLAEAQQLKVATVLPSFIVGPPRTPRVDGESLRNMKQALEGQMPHRGDTNMVDVRDCAAAHIAAAEMPSAVGKRFLTSSECLVSRAFVLATLREKYPQYQIQDGGEVPPPGRKYICGKNLPMLGLSLRDPKTSILDMAEAMLAHGVVKPTLRV